MTKKKLTAVFLALLLVFFTSCGANTESDSETDNGAAIYTQTISLCALHSEDSGLINQVAPHLSSRADSMGYGGSCAERDEEVSLIITSDHELMRDERDEIVKRICMSGNLTFDDSDGNTFLSRSDFESVSLRFDNGYFIDVTLTAEGKEKYASLAATAYEKWQSVKNYIALSCDEEELARVTVNAENDIPQTVSFSGTLTKDMAEWIVYAYENPMPIALKENK